MPIPFKELPPDVQKEIRAYHIERAKSVVSAVLIVSGLGWLMITKMVRGIDMTLGEGVPPIIVFTIGMIVGYTQKAHRDKSRR
jgi:hypothetical protein